jgi:RHS repeat-associated protein
VGRVGTTAADARFYYHTDHLGSVTAITDEAGNTAWSDEFTPFGSAADSENKPDGGFRFASYEYDEDVQLNYALARWQDPETGRFTSLDPARDGVNWYVYCASNPMSFVDPTGLDADSYGGYFGYSYSNYGDPTYSGPGGSRGGGGGGPSAFYDDSITQMEAEWNTELAKAMGKAGYAKYVQGKWAYVKDIAEVFLYDNGGDNDITKDFDSSARYNPDLLKDPITRSKFEKLIDGVFAFKADSPEAIANLKYEFISALIYLYQSPTAKGRIEAVINKLREGGYQITISTFDETHTKAMYAAGADKSHVTIYWDPKRGAPVTGPSNFKQIKTNNPYLIFSSAIVLGHELAGHGYQDFVQDNYVKIREYNLQISQHVDPANAFKNLMRLIYGNENYDPTPKAYALPVYGGLEYDVVESFEKPTITELNKLGYNEAIRDNYADSTNSIQTTGVTSVMPVMNTKY